MTVGDLIKLLSDYNDDMEVRDMYDMDLESVEESPDGELILIFEND